MNIQISNITSTTAHYSVENEVEVIGTVPNANDDISHTLPRTLSQKVETVPMYICSNLFYAGLISERSRVPIRTRRRRITSPSYADQTVISGI